MTFELDGDTEPGWHRQRIPKDDGTVEELWTFYGVEDPEGIYRAAVREADRSGKMFERTICVRGIHPLEAFE